MAEPWKERGAIFGKVRYMSYIGARSKFDVEPYLKGAVSLIGSSLFSVGESGSQRRIRQISANVHHRDTEAQRDFDTIKSYFIFLSVSLCLCGEVVYPY
jgi:hypothetical protein